MKQSTVAGLVSRLYDPQEGQITIDGVALRDLDAGYMREYIGVVPQVCYTLFVGIANYI